MQSTPPHDDDNMPNTTQFLANISEPSRLWLSDLAADKRATFDDICQATGISIEMGGRGYIDNVIGRLAKLVKLGVYGSSGDPLSLPDSIGQLKNLRLLFVVNSTLRLPPATIRAIGQLKRLKHLTLNKNNLSDLPDSFGSLTHVTSLLLGYNKLERLPKSFGSLTRLTDLTLDGNLLSELPKSLISLTNLALLRLCDNNLGRHPESLRYLPPHLKHLFLCDNNLCCLPTSLGSLVKLESLNLSVNMLSRLPQSLARLPRLAILQVSHNCLTRIPPWFRDPEFFAGELEADEWLMPQLADFDATFNEILAVPAWIFNFHHGTFRWHMCNNPCSEKGAVAAAANTQQVHGGSSKRAKPKPKSHSLAQPQSLMGICLTYVDIEMWYRPTADRA